MSPTELTPKTDLRRSVPLTEDMILQGCKEWFAEYGKWPTQNSGKISSGILAGNSWLGINHALHEGGRGLEKGKYKGLGDFKKQKFPRAAYTQLTEDMILQGCKEWFAEHSAWPTAHSGKISSGILAGNSWVSINQALHEGRRGLEKDKYKGLGDFLERKSLKQKYAQAADTLLTEDMILQGCKEWFAEHSAWPTAHSGKISSGILVGNSWASINQALHEGRRGLEKGKYKGLGDFKKQHGLVDGATPDTALAFARAANPNYQLPEKTPVPKSQQILPPVLG